MAVVFKKSHKHDEETIKVALIDRNQQNLAQAQSVIHGIPSLSLEVASNSLFELMYFLKSNPVDILIFGIHDYLPDDPVLQVLMNDVTQFQTNVKVLVISDDDDPAFVSQIISAGASGFLNKDSMPNDLRTACGIIKKHKVFLDEKQQMHILNQVQALSAQEEPSTMKITINLELMSKTFSEREIEVFQVLVQGNSSKQMCEKLFISESTLKTHLSSMLKKSGAESRTHMITIGFNEKWLTL